MMSTAFEPKKQSSAVATVEGRSVAAASCRAPIAAMATQRRMRIVKYITNAGSIVRGAASGPPSESMVPAANDFVASA